MTNAKTCNVSVPRSHGAAGVYDPCREPVTARTADGKCYCANHARIFDVRTDSRDRRRNAVRA